MRMVGYFQGTRHPWAGLLFVLPLLIAYETGLLVLAPGSPETLRNGADTWLRLALSHLGLAGLLWAPLLLLALLLCWCLYRRRDRPGDLVSLGVGMTIESACFAAGLWALSRGFAPFLEHVGLRVTPVSGSADATLEQALTFLGAGIYEEALFRLLMFSALIWLFRLVDFSGMWACVLAALVSAVAFAFAHNIGPVGERFHSQVFLFRTAAGVYFAMLFQLRGFGITVGAHTGYDVLVGMVSG